MVTYREYGIRAVLMVAVLTATVWPAYSQSPNIYRPFEISWNALSYSRQGSVNLYGGDLSFTYRGTEHIGVVADVAIHESNTWLTMDTVTYRFGPKFLARKGERLTVFGEALAGGTRLTGTLGFKQGSTTIKISDHTNGLGLLFGGGMDIGVKPWFAVRLPQVDYSMLKFKDYDVTSHGVRVGVGIVFRFGGGEG